MTPVSQTIFVNDPYGRHGNCLQACIATILDKHLDQVPHVVTFGENWFVAFILFMRDMGYEYIGSFKKSAIKKYKGIDGYVIAYGPSPRGVSHAVIYKNGKMVHDPHPSRDGVKLEGFYLFEPFGEKRESLNWIIR